MSYQSLYRKYRPSKFSDVAGQEITLQILNNSVKNNSIAHAYIFYGPRGTGKTSIAKIFSRLINCENREKGDICNNCPSCIASKEKQCIDIIEIDAASNNGVDEIRELRNKINLVPSELKYKIYIIDEVHMLSIGAFNALLKTLEEPPSHIIFILATTEIQKVPTTILSRCQTLEFKKINNVAMESRLHSIVNKEKIDISDTALMQIIKSSDGGLRDAIGLLEKAHSYSFDKITEEDVRKIIGNISEEEIDKLYLCIKKYDIEQIITLVNKYNDDGIDLFIVMNELIHIFYKMIFTNSKSITNECTILSKLNKIYNDMKNSEFPKIMMEIGMIQLIQNNNSDQYSQVVVEKNKFKFNTAEKSIEISNENLVEPIKNNDFKEIRVNNTFSKPDKNSATFFRKNWLKLRDETFNSKYGAIARILFDDAIPVAASDEYIILKFKTIGQSEQSNRDIHNIEKIIKIVFNKDYKAVCLSEEEWNKYILEYKNNKCDYTYIKEIENITNIEQTDDNLHDMALELFGEI